jgi:hypothetical protein
MRCSTVAVAVVALLGGCVAENMDDVEVSVHGRLKADAAYETAQSDNSGNYVLYVSNAQTGEDNLSITPRETRISINAKKGDTLSGMVEVDFYSAAADKTSTTLPENKTTVMLRHAFVKASLSETTSVLAGQTSDVFSPLAPSTLNYSVGWAAGNMGYRRPQARFEYANGGLSAAIAAASALGAEDAAFPHIQGRVGYTHKNAEGKKAVAVGVSGVSGYTNAARTNAVNAAALDLWVALGSKMNLSLEYHQGQNLKDYLGGIIQGVNGLNDEIATVGYWLQLQAKLGEKLTMNVGYMTDDPDEADLTVATERDLNTSIFVNFRYAVNKSLEAGFEYSNWVTAYQDGTEFDDDRYQLSMIYTF